MQGFDDKALILFPKLENYIGKNYTYKNQFNKALNNLVLYFTSRGIQPYAFYTDDVARELRHPGILFVNPLGDADTFFIAKYCDKAGDAMTLPMVRYDSVISEVLSKDAGDPSMSVEERFEMVIRHIQKGTSKIIPMYKIVAHFQIPKRVQYKVVSKPGDGKIRINISANTFAPKVFMSGQEEDPCDIFAANYCNRCLDMWEV